MKRTELIGRDGVVAFSTLRTATDPGAPYDGFSICHYTGDDPAHVSACREQLAAELGVAPQRLVVPRQTHSLRIAVVGPTTTEADLEGVDALVTDLPGVALCISTADCAPVVIADPAAGVIAACHSGWRGTVGGIAVLTVGRMTELGADPRRMVAAIGPTICTGCFEVGEEVASQFDERFVDRSHTKPHVDLSACIASQLEATGIPRETIATACACSRCNPADYFSARRLGVASGRTATVILRR